MLKGLILMFFEANFELILFLKSTISTTTFHSIQEQCIQRIAKKKKIQIAKKFTALLSCVLKPAISKYFLTFYNIKLNALIFLDLRDNDRETNKCYINPITHKMVKLLRKYTLSKRHTR